MGLPRKREELRECQQIAERMQTGTLTGSSEIGLAVGPALKRYRVKKHFEIAITDTTFSFKRKT